MVFHILLLIFLYHLNFHLIYNTPNKATAFTSFQTFHYSYILFMHLLPLGEMLGICHYKFHCKVFEMSLNRLSWISFLFCAALYEAPWKVPSASWHWKYLHQHKGKEGYCQDGHLISGLKEYLSVTMRFLQELAKTHRCLLEEVRNSVLNHSAKNLYQVFINYKERYAVPIEV